MLSGSAEVTPSAVVQSPPSCGVEVTLGAAKQTPFGGDEVAQRAEEAPPSGGAEVTLDAAVQAPPSGGVEVTLGAAV